MKTKLKKRAVIITAEGFEEVEVIYPLIRLREEGFRVDLATKEKKLASGRFHFPLQFLVGCYSALVDAKKLKPDDYDMVMIPGGFEAPDRVRQIPEVLRFIEGMHGQKKIIAALCHGPWVLISAKILKGRKATCYGGIVDDLKNAGAIYLDRPVVVDENIITSRNPLDINDFMKAIISKFK